MKDSTPGPWRIDDQDGATWRILGPGEAGRFDNEIAELLYTDGNAEANAHLIAAAPELLEALEHANEWAKLAELTKVIQPGSDIESWIRQARAAITKARGRLVVAGDGS